MTNSRLTWGGFQDWLGCHCRKILELPYAVYWTFGMLLWNMITHPVETLTHIFGMMIYFFSWAYQELIEIPELGYESFTGYAQKNSQNLY